MNSKIAVSSGAALLSLAALTMPSSPAEAPESTPTIDPTGSTIRQVGEKPESTESVTVAPFDPHKPWCGTKFQGISQADDLRSKLPPYGIDELVLPPVRPASKGA